LLYSLINKILDEDLRFFAPEEGTSPGISSLEEDNLETLDDSEMDEQEETPNDLEDKDLVDDSSPVDDSTPDELNVSLDDDDSVITFEIDGESKEVTGKELKGLFEIKSRYNQTTTQVETLTSELEGLKQVETAYNSNVEALNRDPLGYLNNMLSALGQRGVHARLVVPDGQGGEDYYNPQQQQQYIPQHFQQQIDNANQQLIDAQEQVLANQEYIEYEKQMIAFKTKYGAEALTPEQYEKMEEFWLNSPRDGNWNYEQEALIFGVKTNEKPPQRRSNKQQRRSPSPAKPGNKKVDYDNLTLAEKARYDLGKPLI